MVLIKFLLFLPVIVLATIAAHLRIEQCLLSQLHREAGEVEAGVEKLHKSGHVVVVGQLIHRLMWSYISCTTTKRDAQLV